MKFYEMTLAQQADTIFALLPDNCKLIEADGTRCVTYPSQVGKPSLSMRPHGMYSLDNFQNQGEHCYNGIMSEIWDLREDDLCTPCGCQPAIGSTGMCASCAEEDRVFNEKSRLSAESHELHMQSLFSNMPTAVTSTGLRVANFSSFHPFTMNDGTIVPACTREWSDSLKMQIVEILDQSQVCQSENHQLFETVMLKMELPSMVLDCVNAVIWAQVHQLIDVVLCPLMVITALRDSGYDEENLRMMPLRTIRRLQRNCDNNLIHHNKFCL